MNALYLDTTKECAHFLHIHVLLLTERQPDKQIKKTGENLNLNESESLPPSSGLSLDYDFFGVWI